MLRSWGSKESDTTEQLNGTDITIFIKTTWEKLVVFPLCRWGIEAKKIKQPFQIYITGKWIWPEAKF